MGKPIDWTDEMDATILRMRRHAGTWTAIAAALKVSEQAVKTRGHNVLGLPARKAAPPPAAKMLDHQAREPLPAGHPIAWDAITEGTTLAGARYPHPVRLDLEQMRIAPNGAAGVALRGA
jgi:hypothetical protein